jgi:hypothetical protein
MNDHQWGKKLEFVSGGQKGILTQSRKEANGDLPQPPTGVTYAP